MRLAAALTLLAALAACAPSPAVRTAAPTPAEVRAAPPLNASELPTEGTANRPAWQYWGFSGGGSR
ncbi:MAG: hypothetical protein ACE37J_09825 [Pikeienuella sp.]|uniref:hypothetical protein n=1 Tax=Pikeienuella sp. TaxID=2831957 RepID=UPI00391A9856